jgi:cytochrome c-type biogenesis protein CcmE
MTPRKKRMALATGLILKSFEENLMYFFSPSDVAAGKAPVGREFRIGGMVEKGSVRRAADSLEVSFTLTDYARQTRVRYTGILPDLFREGQGIVAHGKLDASGDFIAREVLAKHDENYMPPEVADSLKTTPASAPAGSTPR